MARSRTDSSGRSKRYAEAQGWLVGKTEFHNPFPKPYGKKHDLFGFIDLIVLRPFKPILAVQACGTDVSAHKKKIRETPEILVAHTNWIMSGGEVEIWAWRKLKKKRGGKLKVWAEEPRVIPINTLADLGG